jgi:hypothetical protein
MKYGLFDFVGTVGVVIMVVAYLLLQLNRLDSHAPTYSLLNACGASLVIISLTVNFNFSAFLVEAFWVLISLIGIYRYLRTRTLKS